MSDPSDAQLDDALERVAHGATVSILAILFEKFVTFGLTAVLTNGFVASAYGLYALARRFQRVPSSLAGGFMSGFPRYIPTADTRAERDAMMTFGSVLLVSISVLFGTSLTLAAPTLAALTDEGPQFVRFLELCGIGLPALVWLSTTGSLLRSFEEVGALNLSMRVVSPLAQLGVAAVGVVVFDSLVAVLIGTVAVNAILGVGFACWLGVKHDVRPRLLGDRGRETAVQFLRYTIPLFFTGFAYTTQQLGFYPLIAWFLSGTAGAVFVVGALLGGFVRLPLTGINQFISPVISTLHSDGHHEALDRLYQVTTRLVLVGATAIAVPMIVYRRELLSVFGTEYTAFAALLPAFILAQYAASAAGSVGFILTMTDHQKASLAINGSVTALLVVVAVPLASWYGLPGVVTAYLLMNVLNNAAEVVGLYYLEGMQPFTRRHLSPLLAAIPFAGLGVLARTALGGTLGFAVGVLSGLFAYAVVIRLLGLSRVERRLAATIADRYRTTIRDTMTSSAR
ncbi:MULTISPECIES: lipopolysaccharide biosynthesis protein [Halobacterium]|uniref:lipopolysaccharide biosynthesis protein n=1 Tax=Halobacterium TaxID=2239 RepID=UPI00196660AE|nr:MULTISPECIES: lipopolysaccharide biosynthesis protein [Halobacterium]MCF2165786.1 lipopolysaccharide biosynthesis protein [Halobacterium salinarum]MCF2168875.1 lipopolysaccharide biosynthesis protein [Halobacterium salinarum]MCF2237649.1 lipopolysaccharide biosynthesis protein [Halobacterium salinarum]QRY21492.1 lipopolysaccharide biosynthesis protein [Halobacterium sp. GSL-19]WJK64835.1 lipopolysaccharide biosynthesis protein [Halobacterium salinarum]